MPSGTDVFSEITSNDCELISALDWVIYYPHQVEEAFVQVNAVVRNFVAQGKIQAARLAFNKVLLVYLNNMRFLFFIFNYLKYCCLKLDSKRSNK